MFKVESQSHDLTRQRRYASAKTCFGDSYESPNSYLSCFQRSVLSSKPPTCLPKTSMALATIRQSRISFLQSPTFCLFNVSIMVPTNSRVLQRYCSITPSLWVEVSQLYSFILDEQRGRSTKETQVQEPQLPLEVHSRPAYSSGSFSVNVVQCYLGIASDNVVRVRLPRCRTVKSDL